MEHHSSHPQQHTEHHEKKNYHEMVHVKKLNSNLVRYVLLLAIIILGVYLRSYHIDFPVVGYHNWKEVHYLSEARNFAREGFFAHGFFLPAWDYPALHQDPSGVHGDTFPTISILAALMFKIFGIHLLAARIIGLIASVGSIPLFYVLLKRVSAREDIALLGTALAAINPLYVFFSHNVDLINVGLFFTLLGLVFFLDWTKNFKTSAGIAAAAFATLGVMTKYPFIFTVLPFAFVVPWKSVYTHLKLHWRSQVFGLSIMVLLILTAPLWVLYTSTLFQEANTIPTALHSSKLLESKFWKGAWIYTLDNFTAQGFWIFIGGVIVSIFAFLNQRTSTERFFIGSLLSLMLFFPVMAGKVEGHSYHYIYIAPFVLTFMAYFIIFVSNTVASIIPSYRQGIKVAVIASFIFLLWSPSMEASSRQFNTIFPGLDVAGAYVFKHKTEGERAMHSTHQAYGFLWHGDIKGTRKIPETIEIMQRAESELNATWLFIYNWDFASVTQSDRWNYIQDNYTLKQMGFEAYGSQSVPVYFLFHKGGSFNASEINNLIREAAVYTVSYELTKGSRQLMVAEWG